MVPDTVTLFYDYICVKNTNMARFYKLLVIGNDKVGGVLYSPPQWPYPIARDAVDVKNWQSLTVELKYGMYRHFHNCTGGANMVSEKLRDLLLSFIGDNRDIEFLPVKAISDKYGNRVYYIMHFKKIFDVIDKEHTVYVPGTDAIIKLRVDKDKIGDLKVFNSQPAINDVIVSKDVCESIKKNKLHLGLDFLPIYCKDEIG